MFKNLKSALVIGLVAMGASSAAFAGWTPILEVNTPANGRFNSDFNIKTSRIKVTKQGTGCYNTRLNFNAIGRLTNGVPVVLNLRSVGQSSSGQTEIWEVSPTATVYHFDVQTAFGGWDCTYTFSAQTIDEDSFE